VIQHARLVGAGPAVAGVEHTRLVVMLHHRGCPRGHWLEAVGSDRCGGAAAARTVSGVFVSAGEAQRPWPVLVPTSGPGGDWTGQAPPVGLVAKLDDLCRGYRHA
jgi:hypothetical protein